MKISLFLFLSIIFASVSAQDFPIKEWNALNHNKPFIFYISGDGGLNKFSNDLCTTLNQNGYDITALDARSYFWSKKTPQQTADDIANYLIKKISSRPDQQIVLIGYSFGADVLPFVINRLPKTISEKIKISFLIASSGSTDFVIHLVDLFGAGKKRSMDVLSEVNKINNQRVVILNSSDDQGLDASKVTTKNHITEIVPGGHHFDGDIEELTKRILKLL